MKTVTERIESETKQKIEWMTINPSGWVHTKSQV